MSARRVIVTGSRTWPWPQLVWRALDHERTRAGEDGLVVIHGACPQGADLAGAQWCRRIAGSPGAPVVEEPHPAAWRGVDGQLDRRAGYVRNQEMINAGVDMVLGFLLDRSPGTTDCLTRADLARVPALIHRAYIHRSGRST